MTRILLIAASVAALAAIALFVSTNDGSKQGQVSAPAAQAAAADPEQPETATPTSTGEKEVTGQIGLSLAPLREQ